MACRIGQQCGAKVGVDADLKIDGAVTLVGRCPSVKIQLDVTQTALETADPSDSTALIANFISVAHDYNTSRAAPVNRIVPETEREKFLYTAAESRHTVRKRKERDEEREIENDVRNKFEALLAEGDCLTLMMVLLHSVLLPFLS